MAPIMASVLFVLTVLIAPLAAGDGDWPQWRGPSGDGMARGDAPLTWNDTTAAWKATIPGFGLSSPVVWGNRIFLTTAVPTGKLLDPDVKGMAEHRFLVLAYDRRTGKPLWERV